MTGISSDATNDQHILYNPLFLEEDNGPEQPAPKLGKPLGFTHGTSQADSSRADIQNRESLELVAATFQPERIIGPRQLLFIEEPAVAMIGSHRAFMEARLDFPRVVMAPWAVSGVFQPSFCEVESPTTEVGRAHTDLRAELYPYIRRILERSSVRNQWEVSGEFQPRWSEAESSTVTSNLGNLDTNAIWSEILERFNVIAQREDNWDGLESKKPINSSLVRAKRLIKKLLDDLLSAGYSWHMFKPLISCDEDGYITVRWRGKGKRLHLRIEEDEVRYIKSWRENNKRKARTCRTCSDNCFEIWEWLMNG